MVIQIALAAVATIGFSIIFNVPLKELIFCGIAGAAGWAVFMLISNIWYNFDTVVAATFFATMTTTVFGRFLSTIRKMPSTIYIIPAVIPLVPGVGIYFTMFYVVTREYNLAVAQGVESMKIAGVIAIGLLIVLSLPRWMFSLKVSFKKQN